MWSNSEYIWPNAQREWPNARAFGQLRSAFGQMHVHLTKRRVVRVTVTLLYAPAESLHASTTLLYGFPRTVWWWILCLLVYKATNGLAPSYIQDLCVPVTTISTRAALRSAARGDLVSCCLAPDDVSATKHSASLVLLRGTACHLTFELHQHYQLLKTV